MYQTNFERFLTRVCVLLVMALSLSGCKSKTEPDPVVNSDRVIIVYMAANNNLGGSGYDQMDIDEMLQYARSNDMGKNRLFLVHSPFRRDDVVKEVTSHGLVTHYDVLPEGFEAADAECLSLAVDAVKRLAPAQSYGLVLWSHSDGWAQGNSSTRQRSFGLDNGKSIDIPDLASALEGKGLDFLWFDCCFMANIETLYELRRVAPVAVGSVIELVATGMPYNLTLPLMMKSEPDLVGAAKATFDYYDSKSGQSRTCAMSVINLDALDNLASATAAIYAEATMPDIYFTPQKFMVNTRECYTYDFGHYVESHRNISPAKLARWEEAMSEAVVWHAATPKIWDDTPIEHDSGLSTYILSDPDRALKLGYYDLQWWTDVVSAKYTD